MCMHALKLGGGKGRGRKRDPPPTVGPEPKHRARLPAQTQDPTMMT